MSILTSKIKDIFNEVLKNSNIEGDVIVEKTKSGGNGHFASNFPLLNAKKLSTNPMELGQKLVDELKQNKLFSDVQLAKPGFINFILNDEVLQSIVATINDQKSDFGRGAKKNFKYNLELVSANPTGYLHIGHARNGVIGDSMARIFKFNGYDVETEYYTNDAGNQINVLACTMYYNYLKALGKEVTEPAEMYGGDIYGEVVMNFVNKYGDKFVGHEMNDNKISNEEVHEIFREESIKYFLVEIKKQLEDLGVHIGYFSSEKEMYTNKEIEKTLAEYEKLGKTFEADGAL
ncbi:hypothetical protein Zmor_008905 [Zophobas morio]|uniref:Arginyl-tRNA synthetase n=1 Tax=Zophobas morio TaxID=2755281 RepID=A0AA38M072_9CUCU|nr:hypothetical protein Zmor_008905 [Zophobas morio]